MTTNSNTGRTDSVSRIIKARAERIYQAFLDPKAVVTWLPPKGMTGELQAFEPKAGGAFNLILWYQDLAHTRPGKTSDHSDGVRGRFLELVPNRRITQIFEFESSDPAFAGTMKMTWTLNPLKEDTEVVVVCENAPPGISKEDHEAGMASTLANLAAFTE